VAQNSKFDGSTSVAVFRRQFETAAKHNGWRPDDKAEHLIAYILHSVPTGATDEEVAAVLENRYGDHHLVEGSILC
jgi:hypothetical protein